MHSHNSGPIHPSEQTSSLKSCLDSMRAEQTQWTTTIQQLHQAQASAPATTTTVVSNTTDTTYVPPLSSTSDIFGASYVPTPAYVPTASYVPAATREPYSLSRRQVGVNLSPAPGAAS